jgi:hypothetical protein
MNKDKQAFVYLWMDSKNKMWYLGSHCGSKPTYTHSSVVMESFTMRNKPHYMKRRILAYGSNEDMIQLEHNLIEKYDLIKREDYYNLANSFPFPSGPSHPRYIDGRTYDPEYSKKHRQRPEVKTATREYMKEYRQRPEVKAYRKEYRQRPEVKTATREYIKEYMKEYRQRPEVIEYRKEYRQRPEVKAYRKEYLKEYRQRPEVKTATREYIKEYMKEYRQKKRALNI